MGPINSLDPPTEALSNPSNGKDTDSVLDWCQRSVKPQFKDARCRMQDERPSTHPIHHQDTKSTNYLLIHRNAKEFLPWNPLVFQPPAFDKRGNTWKNRLWILGVIGALAVFPLWMSLNRIAKVAREEFGQVEGTNTG